MLPKSKVFKQILFAAAALACFTSYPSALRAAADNTKNESTALNHWNNLTPEERTRLLKNYHEWNTLPPEERQTLKHRWEEFQSLPPERRSQLLTQWHHFQSLPPKEQEKIRHNWQRWQSLSPEEKANLEAQHSVNQHAATKPKAKSPPKAPKHPK